jgi:hypothetical protein
MLNWLRILFSIGIGNDQSFDSFIDRIGIIRSIVDSFIVCDILSSVFVEALIKALVESGSESLSRLFSLLLLSDLMTNILPCCIQSSASSDPSSRCGRIETVPYYGTIEMDVASDNSSDLSGIVDP